MKLHKFAKKSRFLRKELVKCFYTGSGLLLMLIIFHMDDCSWEKIIELSDFLTREKEEHFYRKSFMCARNNIFKKAVFRERVHCSTY